MEKKFSQQLILLLLVLTAEVRAEESSSKKQCCADMKNLYVKLFGGANFLQNSLILGNSASYNTGYVFAGSLGYCWRYGLHWEAEYAFRRNAIKNIQFFTEGSSQDGHFQTSSYMANMLWYLPLSSWMSECWNFRPLIGVGIGYDFQHMMASNSRVVFNQKWHVFSWQAIVGLAYTICCNTELTLEYKFHQGDNFYNHAVGLGVAYKFGLK